MTGRTMVVLTLTATFAAASPPISDPARFVSEVYHRLIESESTGYTYMPPEDIYTARLAQLFRDEARKSKGEVGCLDMLFWVNGQDWTLKNLSVTRQVKGRDRQIVIAKFLNIDTPQEIDFDFRRIGIGWLVNDVQSMGGPRWTLSKLLMCPL